MIRVSLAVIEKNGTVLIARRESDDPLDGLWEFPGGKIRPGETPEECVRREVFEELGLTVERVDYFCTSSYTYDHGAVELLAFKINDVPGQPGRGFYRTVKWVEPCDLLNYAFPAGTVPIIEKLVQNI